MVLIGLWANHVLNRKASIDEIAVRCNVDLLEVVQQRWTLIPGHACRAVDNVVPVQRRHRDKSQVRDVELGSEVSELISDLLETLLVIIDKVHFVDRQNQVRDP